MHRMTRPIIGASGLLFFLHSLFIYLLPPMRYSLLAVAIGLSVTSAFAQSSNPAVAGLRPTVPEAQVAMQKQLKVLAEKTKAAADKETDERKKAWLTGQAKSQAMGAQSLKVTKIADCELPKSESSYRLHCMVSYISKDENGTLAPSEYEMVFSRKDNAWAAE